MSCSWINLYIVREHMVFYLALWHDLPCYRYCYKHVFTLLWKVGHNARAHWKSINLTLQWLLGKYENAFKIITFFFQEHITKCLLENSSFVACWPFFRNCKKKCFSEMTKETGRSLWCFWLFINHQWSQPHPTQTWASRNETNIKKQKKKCGAELSIEMCENLINVTRRHWSPGCSVLRRNLMIFSSFNLTIITRTSLIVSMKCRGTD